MFHESVSDSMLVCKFYLVYVICGSTFLVFPDTQSVNLVVVDDNRRKEPKDLDKQVQMSKTYHLVRFIFCFLINNLIFSFIILIRDLYLE